MKVLQLNIMASGNFVYFTSLCLSPFICKMGGGGYNNSTHFIVLVTGWNEMMCMYKAWLKTALNFMYVKMLFWFSPMLSWFEFFPLLILSSWSSGLCLLGDKSSLGGSDIWSSHLQEANNEGWSGGKTDQAFKCSRMWKYPPTASVFNRPIKIMINVIYGT